MEDFATLLTLCVLIFGVGCSVWAFTEWRRRVEIETYCTYRYEGAEPAAYAVKNFRGHYGCVVNDDLIWREEGNS